MTSQSRFGLQPVTSLMLVIVACATLASCDRPKPAEPPRAARATAAPPAPAKPMKMICRNSQTGTKATCGSPNAVMVGMEPA